MVRSTSHAPAIWAESVFKRFGKTQALQGLDLHVHAGERVALLGPNGAGKTSLVRAICGLIRIDSGTLEVYGQTPRLSLLGPKLVSFHRNWLSFRILRRWKTFAFSDVFTDSRAQS